MRPGVSVAVSVPHSVPSSSSSVSSNTSCLVSPLVASVALEAEGGSSAVLDWDVPSIVKLGKFRTGSKSCEGKRHYFVGSK